jgi:hypothetical protein
VALLPERLYFYRQHPGSLCNSRGRKPTDRILVYDRIRGFLLSRSLYSDYQDPFLEQQLGVFYGAYDGIDQPRKGDVMAMIQERMTDEHWRFVADGQLARPVRDFYLSMNGDVAAKFRRSTWLAARWCYRRLRSRRQEQR